MASGDYRLDYALQSCAVVLRRRVKTDGKTSEHEPTIVAGLVLA